LIRALVGQRGTLWRGALATLLTQEDDIDVVAELSRSDDVLATARQVRPDVVVLDCLLPGTVGVSELCRTLVDELPDCGILTIMDESPPPGVGRALAQLCPQVGMLTTNASPSDLVEAVRQLDRGEAVLDAALAVAALTAQENPLTDREREVLRLAVDGAPVGEIAEILVLSVGTVRNYLSRIMVKTGARSRIEAIRIAQTAGWI
jgi:two-component system response regulator DesR